MPAQTTELTIYSIEPRAFLLRQSAVLQAATDPLEASLLAVKKGVVVVDAWVNVDTAAGVAGVGTLFTRDATPTDATVLTVAAVNSTGITRGVLTTGIAALPSNGALWFKKTGAGTALVFTVFCLLIRPNMNP